MKIYLVGGAVRDQLLNRPVVERDYLVVGATVQHMLDLGFKQVGRDFPVFLHPKTHAEYALARTERKTGRGYLGFTCFTSPDITVQEDLMRRDLTINAMAIDLETNQLIDPYGGACDLKNRVLRHVSNAFQEDPVRILRVARFAARLNFTVAPETMQLMQQMVQGGEVDELTVERVWQEFLKALATDFPARFLEVLAKAKALDRLFSELTAHFEVISALVASPKFLTLEAPLARFAVIAAQLTEIELRAWAKRHKMPKIYLHIGLLAQQFKNAPNMLWPETCLDFLTATFSFRYFQLAEVALASLIVMQDVNDAGSLRQMLRILVCCQTIKLPLNVVLAAKQNGKLYQLQSYLHQKRRQYLYNALLPCHLKNLS